MSSEQIEDDFDYFFNSCKEAYVFWDLKAKDHGVDWDKLRAEYEPTLLQCKSKRDLLRLVNEMQTRLHDGHCANEGVVACGPISLVRVSFVHGEGNRLFISSLKDDSPLAKGGANVGDELLAFGGKNLPSLVKQGRTLFGASSEGQFWSLLSRNIHVWHPYLGEPPEACVVKLKKPDGSILELEVPWELVNREMALNDENFVERIIELDAEGPLPMEARIYDDGNIGYIKVKSFMKMSNPREQLDKVFSAVADTKGLIIDVRNNGGGIGAWGVLLASYVVPFEKASSTFEEVSSKRAVPNDAWMDILYSKTLIRMSYAQAPEDYVDSAFGNPILMTRLLNGMGVDITQTQMAEHFKTGSYKPFYKRNPISSSIPGIPYYKNPVVVLTNGGSYSTTDIFIKILKELKRIKIIGTPNGAGSGSPIPLRMKNSRVNVMVPHAKAFPHTGAMIEGRPVEVDQKVEITQRSLVAGIDIHVEAALSMLNGKSMLNEKGKSPGENDNHSYRVVVEDPYGAKKSNAIDPYLRALIPDSVCEGYLSGHR
jgi:C-terminal processing protease CtpA/Prc